MSGPPLRTATPNGTIPSNRLLAALGPAERALIEPDLELVSLPPGILLEAGETVEHVYFPHNCVISLQAVLSSGETAEVAIFGRESIVGLVSSLVSRETFGRYIVRVPGEASRIPLKKLQKALSRSSKLRQLFLRFAETLMTQAFQTVACNAIHPVWGRCCRCILNTYDRVDTRELPLTHEFIAEALGVQRSSVSVAIRSLQKRGLILQRRGTIVVTDPDRLREEACECYEVVRHKLESLLPLTYAKS